MALNGFDGDFELSLGSITGVRAFELDGLGRLTGVTETTSVFRPGVNLARCSKRCLYSPAPECECGYYAYFKSQDNAQMRGNPVGGIIEGTGRTLIGTKGFRTERAQLIALFPLQSSAPRGIPWVTRALYPKQSWFTKVLNKGTDSDWGLSALIFGAAALVIGTILLFASHPYLGSALISAGLWLLGFVRRLVHVYTDPRIFRRITRRGARSAPEPDPFDRLRLLYPDVPVYKSLRAAVRAHPLTTAEEHVPDPVNTDSFWDLPTSSRTEQGR